MADKPFEQRLTTADCAWNLVRSALEAASVADIGYRAAVEATFRTIIPSEQRANIGRVIHSDRSPKKSYRVVLVVQLAYGLASDLCAELTFRQPGSQGRNGLGGRTGRLLRERNVIAPLDAFQSVGKNSDELVRGNFPAFDSLLRWLAEPSRGRPELEVILQYVCVELVNTPPPPESMPELDLSRLTFAAVMGLIRDLLARPSGGAHEQFLADALLHARAEQDGSGRKVDTKNLNATDRSSGSAADVQVKQGTRVEDAFEVTAEDWATKLAGANSTIRAHDLSRLHILARVDDVDGMLALLRERQDDISAIDLTAFASVLTAELRKQFRAAALRRLYEFLDRRQPNVQLVNQYVRLLEEHGLTVPHPPPG